MFSEVAGGNIGFSFNGFLSKDKDLFFKELWPEHMPHHQIPGAGVDWMLMYWAGCS